MCLPSTRTQGPLSDESTEPARPRRSSSFNQDCLRDLFISLPASIAFDEPPQSRLLTFSLAIIFCSISLSPNFSIMNDHYDDDGLWERPTWARGGVKLRSTGKADSMKKEGNLAAPITFTPFKNKDHTNYYASPDHLASTEVGDKMKTRGDLAMPITNIREEIRKQKMASRYPQDS